MKITILISTLILGCASAATITGLSGNTITLNDGSFAMISPSSASTPVFDNAIFGAPSLMVMTGSSFVIDFGSSVTGGTLSFYDVDTDIFSGDAAFIVGSAGSIEYIPPQNPAMENSASYLTPQFATFSGNSVYISNNGTGSSAFGLGGITLDTTAVPEPSSTALVGLATLAFFTRRKR